MRPINTFALGRLVSALLLERVSQIFSLSSSIIGKCGLQILHHSTIAPLLLLGVDLLLQIVL